MPNDDLRLRITKILTVVCVMPPNGHRLVMDAMTHFKNVKKEKARFETLIKLLGSATSLEGKVFLFF